MRLVELISSLSLCLAQITHTRYKFCASLPDTDRPLDDTEYLTCSTSSGSATTHCRAPSLISNEPRGITSHNPWCAAPFVDELDHLSLSFLSTMLEGTYVAYDLEEQPGAVYVPRVWVETCHPERRLVGALWHIDSVLLTRSSLKPFRGIKVDDVEFACLDLFVRSDLPLGRYEHLARVHILTTQLRISARTQGAGCSPYGRYSGRARIRYPVHVFCQVSERGGYVQLTSIIW